MSSETSLAWLENGLGNVDTRTSNRSKKSHRNVSEYFIGPRDLTRHSKWPRALRMHGSVTPKILIRTVCIGVWATVITVISQKIHLIHIHPFIAGVLVIFVGFSLNLRSSTAYERYMEGRKVWSHLNGMSTSLARIIWVHSSEREGEQGKKDLLAKVSFLNLIIAFAIALKHKVRFEPYIQYDDLHDLVSHLETFARHCGEPSVQPNNNTYLKHIKHLLRIAEPNPRRELKRARGPVGNLPLEILEYMSGYVNTIIDEGNLPVGFVSTVMGKMQSFNDIIVTADRILTTPLPIAYTIAISQITWIYVITLPIQLVHMMGWVTIPASILAAYITLGFAAIGNEIENPFGYEVNDLPLELYCAQIASDIAIIASRPAARLEEFALHPEDKPLYPVASVPGREWQNRDMHEIRTALKSRAMVSKPVMWRKQSMWVSEAKSKVKENSGSVGGSTLNE